MPEGEVAALEGHPSPLRQVPHRIFLKPRAEVGLEGISILYRSKLTIFLVWMVHNLDFSHY